MKTAVSERPRAPELERRGMEIERRASSIPPAVVHAIFEVSPEPQKVIHETPPLPPPVARRSQRPSLRVSKPPSPPRPSVRPHAETEEESLEPRFSLLSSAAVPVLSAPPTDAAPPPARDSNRSGPWFVAAAVALLLVTAGVVIGVRTRNTPPRTAQAAPVLERKPAPAAAAPAPVLELPREPPGSTALDSPGAADDAESAAASSAREAAEAARASAWLAPAALVDGSGRASTSSPEAAPSAPAAPAASAGDAAEPALAGFDARAASSAVGAALERAAACKQPSDPGGAVTATLTFAPSGRVTNALVSGAFAGTPTGSCIAGHLRSARVPAFSGDYTTVKRSVVLK